LAANDNQIFVVVVRLVFLSKYISHWSAAKQVHLQQLVEL